MTASRQASIQQTPFDAEKAGLRSSFLQKSQGRPGQYYEAVSKLGEGAFGVAHLVRNKQSAVLRVLKTINKRQSQVPPGQLEKEIRNLKACDHPHIIRLFEYYEDYENIYLIMEHAEGGELRQVLEAQKAKEQWLPERWVSLVIKQALMAIAYVHSQGIIHKDLKTENILLLKAVDVHDTTQQPHAVIIDLGIAELFSARLGRRARCTVVAGTPTHMAPEVWRGSFGQVADVWSLGVVMFELLSGDYPFQCNSMSTAAEWLRLHRQGPNWSLISHHSNQARAICQRMLSSDERMRPTAQQCLGHTWFKEENGFTLDAPEPEEDAAPTLSATSGPPPPTSAAPTEVADAVGESLKDYVGRSKFEKVVMLQVASQVHVGQMTCISEFFTSADTDYNGRIENSTMLTMLLNLGVDHSSAESYVQCLDADADGGVEYVEFVSGCIGLLYESLRGLLWQSFCIFDVDGNGVLSPEEVQAVLTRAELIQHGFPGNEPVSSVQEVISRMDVDGNGQISFDELCRLFLARPDMPGGGGGQEPVSARGRAPTRPVHDEEFAQLLDEIEADHGHHGEMEHAAAAGMQMGHDQLHHIPDREGLSPASAFVMAHGGSHDSFADEIAAMGVASNPVPPPPPPPRSEVGDASVIVHCNTMPMSVDEELNQLLADVAHGP